MAFFPLFPAAATTTTPASTSFFTELQIGSSSKELIAGVPKLIFTTLTLYEPLFAISQSNAANTFETFPTPCESRTRRLTSFAPGAIPSYAPCVGEPSPAAIAATWVPCPYGSSVRFSPVKSLLKAILPERLENDLWFASIPESRTAIDTPEPSSVESKRLPDFVLTCSAPVVVTMCPVVCTSASRDTYDTDG